MGGDKSLRHRLRAVIDELGLAAPLPLPTPSLPPPPQFLPPWSRCGGESPTQPCFSLIKHLALCGLGSLRPLLTAPPLPTFGIDDR